MWLLVPRELRFFDDFERLAEHVLRAAALLHALVGDFSDVPAVVKAIKDVEHAGDRVTHEVIARLHTSFVTPFDRHDIHVLTTDLTPTALAEIDFAPAGDSATESAGG